MTSPTTALVTGATQGIGRAVAFAFGRAGFRVGVCARTAAHVEALVSELGREGVDAAGAPADVSDPAQVAGAVEHVASRLGDVGVLINNAGVLVARPFEELTLEEWDTTMAVNVRSLYIVTRAVLPAMRRLGGGTIVNVASLAGRNGFAGGTAYTASKHAVLGFGRSLMLELRKDGIRVVTVCPGSVDTALLRDQPMLKSNPSKILRPEDVADTILQAVRLPGRALVSELDIRPTNPQIAVPSVCVTMCVCRRRPFAELLPAARAGGWDLATLSRETGCGAGCGLCRPYLRRMLATGATEFHELLWETPDE